MWHISFETLFFYYKDGLPVINSIKTITTSKRFDCCSKCLHFPGCNSVSFMMNASENNCRLSSSIDGVSVSAGLSSEVFKKNPSSVRVNIEQYSL